MHESLLIWIYERDPLVPDGSQYILIIVFLTLKKIQVVILDESVNNLFIYCFTFNLYLKKQMFCMFSPEINKWNRMLYFWIILLTFIFIIFQNRSHDTFCSWSDFIFTGIKLYPVEEYVHCDAGRIVLQNRVVLFRSSFPDTLHESCACSKNCNPDMSLLRWFYLSFYSYVW